MSVSDEQLMKALSPIDVIFGERSMMLCESQNEKAPLSMDVTVFGSVTYVRCLQLAKALVAIEVTPLGILTDVIYLHNLVKTSCDLECGC